jgi:catalase
MVNALHTAFGEHHARAVHTKGVILDGVFTPAPEARTIVKTPIFSGGPLPIVARCSRAYPICQTTPTAHRPWG